MMVRRKNLRKRQGSCKTRAREESRRAKSVLNFKGGRVYTTQTSRRVVVVDKPALKVMARENERRCREADKNDHGEKEVTSERTGR